MLAIPYCKLTVIVLIPLASKRQKSTRRCLNERFNGGEKSPACMSTFAASMKAFNQQKKSIIQSGGMAGKYDVN